MWTMTTVTRRTPTCTRSEHACALFRLSRHSHWHITFHLAQGFLSLSSPSSRPCTCAVVSMLLHFSFYLTLLFSFLFPVLLLDVRLRLWLRDKQPAQLRQWDLRHPGRFLPFHPVMSPTTRSSSTTRSSTTRSPASSLTSRIPLVHFAPSSDHDVDDETLGKLLAEVHRDYADYRRPEGVSVSPSSMSVMVDRTEKPVEKSDIDHFGFSVRNVYSAQNQFPAITQTEGMVDRTGKPVEEIIGIAEERESSSAQIRTLFNEQRRTIIAECCEKVSHHELQAARAEQERKILQEELWRQQMVFGEVHRQSLTEMEELRKFQSSTYDTLTRQKFIEDQNTLLWNYLEDFMNCRMK